MCVRVCVCHNTTRLYLQSISFFFVFNSRIAATADTARLLRFLFLMNNFKKSKLLLYITEKTNHCFIKLHHNTLWLSWLGCANVLSYLVKGSIKLCRLPLICLICMSRIGTDLLLPVWKKKKNIKKTIAPVSLNGCQPSVPDTWAWTKQLSPCWSEKTHRYGGRSRSKASVAEHKDILIRLSAAAWSFIKMPEQPSPNTPPFLDMNVTGLWDQQEGTQQGGAAYHLLPPLRDLHLNTLSCVLTVIMLRSLDI